MTARIAHVRTAPLVVRPSPVAVERALWLAALDRCLRSSPADAAPVREAYAALRAAIDAHAPALYRATPVEPRVEGAWLTRVQEEAGRLAAAIWRTGPATPALRAAIVVWAAVEAWSDAPSGRWATLAACAADVGRALDAAHGDAGTGHAASVLRLRVAV